jgi:hypothetical protein
MVGKLVGAEYWVKLTNVHLVCTVKRFEEECDASEDLVLSNKTEQRTDEKC